MRPPLSITTLMSNIRYENKQKLVLAAMPAKKRRIKLSSPRNPEIENSLKAWIVNHREYPK